MGYPGSDQPPASPPAAPPPPPAAAPPPGYGGPPASPPPSPGYGYAPSGGGSSAMALNMSELKPTPAMIVMLVGAAMLLLAALPILPWATASAFGISQSAS